MGRGIASKYIKDGWLVVEKSRLNQEIVLFPTLVGFAFLISLCYSKIFHAEKYCQLKCKGFIYR